MKKGHKRFGQALVGGLVVLVLAACGAQSKSSAGTAGGSSDQDEVKILSGNYVIPSNGDTLQDTQGYLALKLAVKNTTSHKQSLSSYNITLKDSDGDKLEGESLYSDEDGMTEISAHSLTKGETAKGYVMFKVKNKAKYTLVVEPSGASEDVDKTELKLNATKYKDNTDAPKQALKSYVNQVFLNHKDLEYTKTVVNKSDEEAASFATQARSFLEDAAFTTALQQIQAENLKRGGAEYEIKLSTPTAAEIEVTPKVLNLTDAYSVISDLSSAYYEAHDDATMDEADDAANEAFLAKFGEILPKFPVKADSYGEDVKLVKQDGKWKIDSTTDDFQTLQKTFAGDNY
ncbi:MAG: DUF4352 domain-containing protein [Lactobacillus sp.]|jgi:hypothetical protein|nr:DUF4352 domain-containing protein [Lactobacillus sp.]MCI2034235.1 DUF4352 domain-containing protein [Lactobacillus sp.]